MGHKADFLDTDSTEAIRATHGPRNLPVGCTSGQSRVSSNFQGSDGGSREGSRLVPHRAEVIPSFVTPATPISQAAS